MATAYVTLGPVETRDVFNGKAARSETITTSGTAASGALIAAVGDIAQVFCVTAVYARSGSPATGATSVFCPGGVLPLPLALWRRSVIDRRLNPPNINAANNPLGTG